MNFLNKLNNAITTSQVIPNEDMNACNSLLDSYKNMIDLYDRVLKNYTENLSVSEAVNLFLTGYQASKLLDITSQLQDKKIKENENLIIRIEKYFMEKYNLKTFLTYEQYLKKSGVSDWMDYKTKDKEKAKTINFDLVLKMIVDNTNGGQFANVAKEETIQKFKNQVGYFRFGSWQADYTKEQDLYHRVIKGKNSLEFCSIVGSVFNGKDGDLLYRDSYHDISNMKNIGSALGLYCYNNPQDTSIVDNKITGKVWNYSKFKISAGEITVNVNGLKSMKFYKNGKMILKFTDESQMERFYNLFRLYEKESRA
ncbi:hypothetical protein MEO40_17745 [Dolichospermum sp. ST_sed1]|nr:hypothetical protein [Dolichospermum sp. ST_sed1]